MASSSSSKEGRSAPRYYLVGLVLFMIGVVIAGFWPSYFGPGLQGTVPEAVSNAASFPWLVHLHAAVFLGWMGMLLAQTTLVARGKTQAHMSVGRYGIGLGTVVLLGGLTLTFLTYQTIVSQGKTWVGAFTVAWPPLVSMIEFGVLLTIGYLYRTGPAVHKRMMLFATVTLLPGVPEHNRGQHCRDRPPHNGPTALGPTTLGTSELRPKRVRPRSRRRV